MHEIPEIKTLKGKKKKLTVMYGCLEFWRIVYNFDYKTITCGSFN